MVVVQDYQFRVKVHKTLGEKSKGKTHATTTSDRAINGADFVI